MNVSKTVIFNVLALTVGIAGYLVENPIVQAYPNAVALLGAAVAIGNIVLRYFTSLPMTGWLIKGPKA